MKNEAPSPSQSGFSVMAAASDSLGSDSLGSDSLASVYVFNCAALNIIALQVNGTNVAPTQGIAAINLGSPPSSIAIPRTVFGKSATTAATFDGYTQPSWSQSISISQLPMINMYLWCFLNGFVLADQYGVINYLFGQSSLSTSMSSVDSIADEWPESRRVISVAL